MSRSYRSIRDRSLVDVERNRERRRTRFMENILIDIRPWTIGRKLQQQTGGESGEGLRGIYTEEKGQAPRIYWWAARQCSHNEGRQHLGIGSEHNKTTLEVEANIDPDGTIYLCWSNLHDDMEGKQGGESISDRFLLHPSLGTLIDGCLAVGERQIRLDENGMHLCRPGEATDRDQIIYARRHKGWTKIIDLVGVWTRGRKPYLEDGRPRPPSSSLAPLRRYLSRMEGYCEFYPIPKLEILDDGSLVFEWRKTGSLATMRFADHHVHLRLNDDGRIREWPAIPVRTSRQAVVNIPWDWSFVQYKDASESGSKERS